MKKMLIGFLTLGCVSAFAFPTGDVDRLSNIGSKTKLKVLSDLYVAPNRLHIALGKHCFLHLAAAKDFERVLSAGSILRVQGSVKAMTVVAAKGKLYEADVLYLDNENVRSLYCKTGKREVFTIQDFKNDMLEILEVERADIRRI